MEEIHNTYSHFDWYTNFIIEFVENSSIVASMAGISIVNTVVWVGSRKGRDYWCSIYIDLEKKNFVFTAKQHVSLILKLKNSIPLFMRSLN